VNALDHTTSPIDLRWISTIVARWSTWQLWLAYAWKHMLQFQGRWTLGFLPICSQIEPLEAAKCRLIFRSGSLFTTDALANLIRSLSTRSRSLVSSEKCPFSLVAHPTLQTSKRLDLTVVAQDARNCLTAHALRTYPSCKRYHRCLSPIFSTFHPAPGYGIETPTT
jgi:hypothetical protein